MIVIKYGVVKIDYVLFVVVGVFYVLKLLDLISEL